MSDVILLGNTQPEKRHQSGNVYFVGGCSPTLMAGTHGYGFGYFMEIEKMIIEEQKPELIYQGGVRLNLHESGADGYTELYDNSI